MVSLGRATISTHILDSGELHALYAVFAPGETAARTLLYGREHDCHAYIDVDENGFPIAIELRGWKTVTVQGQAPKPQPQERFVRALLSLAFDLLGELKERDESRRIGVNRIQQIGEEAAEELAVA